MFLEEQLWKLILEDTNTNPIHPHQSEPLGSNGTGKKKRKRVANKRDSQARRIVSGKPGSKRHNRFVNQLYLTQASQTEEESQEPDTLFEEWTSPISLVFEPENKEYWEPFVDITEEEEKFLLDQLAPKKVSQQRWTRDQIRLNKAARNSLVKYRESEFLRELERELMYFITEGLAFPNKGHTFFTSSSTSPNQLRIIFEDDFHRFLGHSVCRFYNLESHSVDQSSTKRVFVVQKLKNHFMPPSTLLEYLNNF